MPPGFGWPAAAGVGALAPGAVVPLAGAAGVEGPEAAALAPVGDVRHLGQARHRGDRHARAEAERGPLGGRAVDERRGDLQKLTDEYVLILVGRLPDVLFNAPIP